MARSFLPNISQRRRLTFHLPAWMVHYQKNQLSQDILAGGIVGVLVIPQSLGYAVLSGLPPVYGLYSAIVPVLVYAWVGSSSVNAVGPVAITAIMTAATLQRYSHLPAADYTLLASLLAFLVGTILWLASVFRLGWITQFISRGVTAGFVSGASILILLSQLKFVTGIPIDSHSIISTITSFWQYRHTYHRLTLGIGLVTFCVLWINRYYLKNWLANVMIKGRPISAKMITIFTRLLPLSVVIIAVIASLMYDWSAQGVRVIASIPNGLPHWVIPFLSNSQNSEDFQPLSKVVELLPSAGLMALVAFVSSHSVASAFARLKQEKFDPNQELKGLALANVIGAFFQSFAVVGGFSRTAVNVEAGAKSPLASVLAVAVMVMVLVFFSQWLTPLPYAVLGANIMVAIVSLIDLETLKSALKSDPLDATAFVVTLVSVLVFGLNIGLIAGLFVSFGGLIWQSSHPHIAIVGQIGNSGHFRNIARYQVTQHPNLLIIRIDESLFYGNASAVQTFIEKALQDHATQQPLILKHVILMLSAVNHIDLAAQEMLISVNSELAKRGIMLHFSEVKGPVMDVIEQTDVIKKLSGKVFLSTHQAVNELCQKSIG